MFISSFQHIDNIMSIYGNQIMQAVVFILEGDHSAQVKEQVGNHILSHYYLKRLRGILLLVCLSICSFITF